MANLNSQCLRPPFLSATAVGSGGKAPTPEADDILAMEHTFLRYPAWFLSDSLCRQNRQLPDKMSTRYTTLPNYTA